MKTKNKTDVEKIEEFIDDIIEKVPENNIVPIEQIKLYKHMLFHPEEVINQVKDNPETAGSFKDALFRVMRAVFARGVVQGGLSAVIMILVSLPFLVFGLFLQPLLFIGVLGIIGGVGVFIFSVVCTPILSGISWAMFNWLIRIFSKLLGGKGDQNKQYYLTSLVTSGIILAGILLIPFMFIPLVNYIVSIISFIIGLYAIYLYYKIVKEVYGMSGEYSLLSIILAYLIIFIITFIVIIFLFYLLFSLMMGSFFLLGGVMASAKASNSTIVLSLI